MTIPPQAIEAAAEAQTPGLFTLSDHRYGIEYDNPPQNRLDHQKFALEDARTALEAALPHLLPAREQIAETLAKAYGGDLPTEFTDVFEDLDLAAADAVLALIQGETQ